MPGFSYARKLVQKYKAVLDSKLTASQRQLLDAIVKDAVIYVGKQWEEVNGQEKFSLAVAHVLDSANHYGLNLSVQDVQAAIEAAYQRSKVDNNTTEPNVNVSVTLDGQGIAQAIIPTINSDQVVQAIAGPVVQIK